MATPTTLHVCRDCGFGSSKWLGRCPECGAWASMVERAAPSRAGASSRAVPPVPVPFRALDVAETARTSTGLPELDRALGGGLVPGGVVLLGGEPGIGKSTLVLQAASEIATNDRIVLYVSAEESAAQIGLRGRRVGLERSGLLVLAETDVDAALAAAIASRASVLIVDSIQAVRCGDTDGTPGSVAQVRESASRFIAAAKSAGVPTILVGHVTKDGALAGPRALEHAVDTVLQFEGDRFHAHRILRTLKNRYGPSDEIGVFSMTDSGLRGVASPSEVFLAERPAGVPGSAVLAAIEGTRPLLLEVQALVGEPVLATPRRTALGVEAGRLALILAVLEKRAGLALGTRDVFVNVPGGLAVTEPAADLAIALAAASSLSGQPLPERTVVIGEIGLAGEVRSVSRLETRLREAHRMGFVAAIVPDSAAVVSGPTTLERIAVGDVPAALRAAARRGAVR